MEEELEEKEVGMKRACEEEASNVVKMTGVTKEGQGQWEE